MNREKAKAGNSALAKLAKYLSSKYRQRCFSEDTEEIIRVNQSILQIVLNQNYNKRVINPLYYYMIR